MLKKIVKNSIIYVSMLSFTIFSVNSSAKLKSEKLVSLQHKTIIKLKNCHLKGIRTQVKCGSLVVPENYAKPDKKTITINIAVLPAIDNSRHKTPFMFLAGGPGQAAVELAAPLRKVLTDIRKTRDIILIDQRGTGKSQPLKCDDVESQNIYTVTQSDFTADEVKKCLAEIAKQSPNIDLSQYNSENAIRDFDRVRKGLGYKKINLYGGSYGTRAALVYMKMFPQHIRSVVLDAVAPIEVPIGLFGQSSARSFHLLLQHCRQEKLCHKAFPQLENEFTQLVHRLEKSPVKIKILHPRLGVQTTFIIDKNKLINNIRMQLYSVEMRSLVPLVIHQAYLGNYLPLAGLVAQGENGDSIYIALTFNIVCNEDYPKITPAMIAKDASNNFGGNNSQLAWLTACPVWPKYRPKAEFYNTVTANIPTLIFSGELDPVTPASNGAQAAKSLPNSHHIIIENSAHTSLGTCAPKIIAEFLTTLKPNKLDESCLKKIPKETFMTNLNGSI